MIGVCLRSSTTPTVITPMRIMTMMVVSVMPTRIVVMEVGVEPRIIPHVTIVITTPVMSPMTAIMVRPRTTPSTPPERIAHTIIPIIPITGGREHIGIHSVIIDIPIPAGP